MSTDLEIGLYIFMLAAFLGYHLISRVPPLLHTPLMSATNAMSGISLIGSMLVAGAAYSTSSTIMGFIAVVCASTNVVGGFLITDRMLRMFKSEADRQQNRRDETHTTLRKRWILALIIAVSLFTIGSFDKDSLGIGRTDFTQSLELFYIASAALFILGLKGLSSPKHARRGMFLAELGMLLAVIGTLFHRDIVTYKWIATGLGAGSIIGGSMGFWIPMTAVPQRTAFSHALGALAVTLIGISEYARVSHTAGKVLMATIGLEVVIGALTFTGSLMAAGKLQGMLPGAPITYKGQNVLNIALLGLMIGLLVYLILLPSVAPAFWVMVAISLLFGLLLIIPIGAADMPVVISLLNSYAGLAGASMGFALMNKIQIITGSLDGTSGLLLSLLMCRAMNRSPSNVLFGAFGKPATEAPTSTAAASRTMRSIMPDEIPPLLESSRSVVIVPGYGMAVAQAQHAVAELANVLVRRGLDVKYAIHPVAGRMPGHMNVLLAEANVPYDRLFEMERINPYFGETDLVIVVGANDITNPAAKHDRTSPLYGMPILEVQRARAIIVLKRSTRPGFAGVENELYYDPKCMMLFGDAKDSITNLLAVLK
jgi:proton-translocating NAD(P)+ transhydrogenase subunit beta